MASIKDVAKRAGVGVGTVSRAMNGTGYVSVDTKKKIDKAVEELNYTPNELARNLFRKRTGIIGVVIPDLEHPFFSNITKHIEMELYKHGYKTMVCNTVEISDREKDYLNMLERNIVDGIITGAHSLEDEEYIKIKKPIVSLDRDFGSNIPLIHSDHVMGGRMAAELLLKCGCKRIGQIKGYTKVHTPSNNRHVEFERIMNENGIKIHTLETAWNKFSYDNYREVSEAFMNEFKDLDGVFLADISAVLCMNIARERGIKIPDELQIIGYDAMEITRLASPTVTAIKQDTKKLAKLCVNTVLKLINGDNDIEYHQVIDVKLQQGGTTKKIAAIEL